MVVSCGENSWLVGWLDGWALALFFFVLEEALVTYSTMLD
jgi:hypothetical protein